jgi:hypothetical protein
MDVGNSYIGTGTIDPSSFRLLGKDQRFSYRKLYMLLSIFHLISNKHLVKLAGLEYLPVIWYHAPDKLFHLCMRIGNARRMLRTGNYRELS